MKELEFVVGPWPKGFKPDFESFLFNDEQHRLRQSALGWQTYCLVRKDKKRVMASISFCLSGGIALSPFKAPFGSVELSNFVQPKDLFEFLKRVEQDLRAKGIKTISIKNAPASYQPFSSVLLDVSLINQGYRILDAEINTSIAIDKIKYDQKIENWELRKLRQAKKANLKFQRMPVSLMDEVYQFIDDCRKERGQSLSMTLPELLETSRIFPEEFILFTVQQGRTLAAASISIRVNKRIIYNFYSAHPRKFDTISPVVTLIQGIYHWSQKNEIDLVDLGTSALEGEPNFSLLDFKLRLGGSPSTKFNFQKDLD